MESKKLFIGILVFGILILVVVSAANIFYYKNGFLKKEIENHLTSVIEIKGERMNDYFIERNNDLSYISGIGEVENILSGKFVSSENSIESYLNYKLEIISKQLDIILEKYPEENIDYFNQNDFKKIISQPVGKTGFTYIADSSGKVVIGEQIMRGNFEYAFDKVFEIGGQKYYLKGFGNSNEFLISENFEEMETLDLFFEVSNYSNFMLVSLSGDVVYDSIRGNFYGLNLNDYSDVEISKAYLDVLSKNEPLIYGPYKIPESEGLELLFSSPVYSQGVVIGYVFLVDSFNKIEKISLEEVRVGQEGSFYVVKNDNFLVTPIKGLEEAVLVQSIDTENTKKCFGGETGLDIFIDYRGDSVLGSSYYLAESGWCLISEVSEKDLFLYGFNFMNFVFILIFGVTFILGRLIFKEFWQAQIKSNEKVLFISSLIAIGMGIILKVILTDNPFNFVINETYLLLFFILEIIGFLVMFSCFFNNGSKHKWF